MFDNNINVIFDKTAILITFGVAMGILACFMLKKGIEHAIMHSARSPRTQGIILSLVALGILACSALTVLLSNRIVGLFEAPQHEEVVVAKKRR